MFGTILITICTFMHVYVFWRAAAVPFVARHIPRKALMGIAVLLWVLFYLGRVVGHDGAGIFAAALEFSGMTWMAVLFLTFVPLLAVDSITVFGFLLPKRSPSLRGWALVAGAALSGIALFQGLRPPVIEKYEVRRSNIPPALDGTVIVAISDTHLGTQIGGRWLAARIEQIKTLEPDIVVLLGDIFEGHGGNEVRLTEALGKLTSPLGVWAVPGNHEFHGGGRAMHLYGGLDCRLLRNEWGEPKPGLILAGVDDFTTAKRRGRGEDFIQKALAGKPDGVTILLSHTPWHAETAAKAGVDLMLSGHTHAGQIWPFGYLVRRRYPLFAGRYEVGGMPVIVCRGTGTWGPRMRLWRPGEILYVILRSDQESIRKSAAPSPYGK